MAAPFQNICVVLLTMGKGVDVNAKDNGRPLVLSCLSELVCRGLHTADARG